MANGPRARTTRIVCTPLSYRAIASRPDFAVAGGSLFHPHTRLACERGTVHAVVAS